MILWRLQIDKIHKNPIALNNCKLVDFVLLNFNVTKVKSYHRTIQKIVGFMLGLRFCFVLFFCLFVFLFFFWGGGGGLFFCFFYFLFLSLVIQFEYDASAMLRSATRFSSSTSSSSSSSGISSSKTSLSSVGNFHRELFSNVCRFVWCTSYNFLLDLEVSIKANNVY